MQVALLCFSKSGAKVLLLVSSSVVGLGSEKNWHIIEGFQVLKHFRICNLSGHGVLLELVGFIIVTLFCHFARLLMVDSKASQ